MTSVKQTAARPPDPEDESLGRLIVQTGRGDREAFERLYRETSPQVYAYALSVLKNPADAQDVLQNCFLQVYRSAPAYEDRGKGKSFIMTIAANLCRMQMRQNQRSAFPAQEDWIESLDDTGLSPYQLLLIKECMNALDDTERKILVLHAVSGFRHREIAKLLQMPLPTVLSKYNRAVKKLQKKFGKGD